MEGKYALSDVFFSLSLRAQILSNQSRKQGLIYSIESLLSQKHLSNKVISVYWLTVE